MHGFITDILYKQRKKSLKQANSMIEASNMGNINVVQMIFVVLIVLILCFVLTIFNLIVNYFVQPSTINM